MYVHQAVQETDLQSLLQCLQDAYVVPQPKNYGADKENICFRATVLSQTLSLSTRCVERDKNNLPKVPKELRPVYNQNNSKQCRLVFENLGHLSGA